MKDWIKRPWFWPGIWLHVAAAWFSVGWQHADEHFQIIEFAQYGLGLVSSHTLPWEFEAQIRPTIQVFLSMLVLKAGQGLDPFLLAFFLRLLLTSLALAGIFWVHLRLRPILKEATVPSLVLSLFGWALVYSHVRFSSENASGLVLFLTLPLLSTNNNDKRWRWLVGGLLFGLAFALRFQSGFFIAGWGVCFLFSPAFTWSRTLNLALGFLLALGTSVLLDSWFYDQWVFTPYAYFEYNILKGVAAQFGREPWYWYIQQMVERLVPPFSLAVFPALFFLWKQKGLRSHALGILVFLGAHSLVSHKEWRFLFPMAYFLPLGLGLVYQQIEAGLKNRFRILGTFVWLFWLTNTLLLIPAAFQPASEVASLYKFLYSLPKHTLLLYEKEDPYLSGSNPANFYIHKTITRKEWKPQEWAFYENSFQAVVLIRQCSPLEKPPVLNGLKGKPIYQTYPDWAYRWLSRLLKRSSHYTVYAWPRPILPAPKQAVEKP